VKLFARWRKKAARPEPGTAFPARGSHDATVVVDPPTGAGTGPGTVVIPELADEEPATVAHAESGEAPRAEPARRGPARAARPSRSGVVGVVVAVEGELAGTAIALYEGSNRIGRDAVCEVCLASESVSSLHACIDYRVGIFRIEPLGDASVRVNFEPCAGAVLRDGDVLQIGRTTLRFRSIVGG
jgi:hypothetical protein